MTTPISFTVRPPTTVPHRPSPLGNGGGRSGPPSRRFFEQNNGDEDEDDEEDDRYRRERRERPREEKIEGFGRDGKALGGQKAEGPMVIPALPNRDWRQVAARRTPSYRPEERKQEEMSDNKPDRLNDEPRRSGLRYMVKKENVAELDGGVQVKREREDAIDMNQNGNSTAVATTTTTTTTVKTEPVDAADPPKPLTLEEQALQAILAGDQSIESEADRLQREMIIESAADRQIQAPSEADALQRDLDALPDESTGDDYRNVPIEAFGMAMLRGMGWNPNDESNTKIHVPKARPGQLGLGATPMSEIIPPSHDKKSKREDRAKRGGRGFNASGIMIKREINGGGSGSASGSATPAGSSRRTSPESESDSRRRRREDEYDGRREGKRRDRETEEERARRKAKERQRDRDYDDRERSRDKDRYDEKERRDKYDERDRRARYSDDRDRDRDRR